MKPVRAFIAVVKIIERDIYRVLINENFQPYRKNAVYEPCKEISIRPLIE